jgi:hypothetical protein
VNVHDTIAPSAVTSISCVPTGNPPGPFTTVALNPSVQPTNVQDLASGCALPPEVQPKLTSTAKRVGASAFVTPLVAAFLILTVLVYATYAPIASCHSLVVSKAFTKDDGPSLAEVQRRP